MSIQIERIMKKHPQIFYDVMYCAGNIFQDKQWFIEENPNDHKAHKRILSGEFDSNNPRFLKNTKKYEKTRKLELWNIIEGEKQ